MTGYSKGTQSIGHRTLVPQWKGMCVCVCVCVCVFSCVYVCVYDVYVYDVWYMWVCMYVGSVHVCVHVCVYDVYVYDVWYMWVCMYVGSVHVCVHVCACVCACVWGVWGCGVGRHCGLSSKGSCAGNLVSSVAVLRWQNL
jgi:hypothetical protein